MQPISQQEMCGFLGKTLSWATTNCPPGLIIGRVIRTLVCLVSSVLPRNRFSQILGNLHIYDNHAILEGNKDKLLKVRPLIAEMNNYSCTVLLEK